MLEAVCELAPDIYPLVHTAYSTPSSLRWKDKIIESDEGLQQGDPLGPLLFCLTLHCHCEQMLLSPLCMMYLDDVSMAGSTEDILHDLEVIKAAEELGLVLNNSKSEIICSDASARGTIITAANVSGQVASQNRGRPELHGTRVIPSGLLPSDLDNPDGSRRDGIPAADSEQWMISFTAACLK